jgi:DNA-binding NarL/FixJ family response regulator
MTCIVGPLLRAGSELSPCLELRVLLVTADLTYTSELSQLIIDNAPEVEIHGLRRGTSVAEALYSLRPDVLVLDLELPSWDDVAAFVRAQPAPLVKVVVVSSSSNERNVWRAIQVRSRGYVLKSSSSHVVLEAFRSALTGGMLLCPSITVDVLAELAHPRRLSSAVNPLSSRENEIAGLIARGLTNTETGAVLEISIDTVKTHISRIQTKLGFRNRVEIAVWAHQSW